MAAFGILTVAAGMVFVQKFPPRAVAVVIPVALGCTLAFLISAVWAVFPGESVVAAICGVVTAFSLGLAVLLLGLFNNWFPAVQAVGGDIKEVYFIAFAIFWATLALPFLRLPVLYEVLVVLVTAATALLAAGALRPPENELNLAAGRCLLAFAAGLFYIRVNQALLSVGLKGLPIGKPLVA
jgi:hypothetical protein